MLQFQPGTSWLHRIDPLSKFFWVCLVGIMAFLVNAWESNAFLFAAVLLTLFAFGHVARRTFVRGMVMILILAAALMFFQVGFNKTGEVIVGSGFLSITTGGLDYGGVIATRTALFAITSLVFVWTTDPRDLAIGFTRLGVPYRFAFALFIGLRFIPVWQDEVQIIREAQAVRGVRRAEPGLAGRYRALTRFLLPVFVSVLRRAENTAIAMDSRAFGAFPRRTYVNGFRWTRSGALLLVTFIALSVIVLAWGASVGALSWMETQGLGTGVGN